jgi:hypothetical protein
MSKKKLLEEGTVRQFMKLANLKPLASDFINETYGDMSEEGIYEQEGEMEDELPPEAGAEMDMAPDEEAPMDDMDMAPEEEGAEGALAGVSEEAVEALISVVADALAGATGVEIDVMGGEEGMEGEEGMDMAPEGEEDMDFAPAVGDEGEEEEMALQEIDMVDEEAVMKETYRRVTNRLTGMNKQHKLVESVTNRIMQRLNKSK